MSPHTDSANIAAMEVNVRDATTRLSRLLRRVAAGEEIVIVRRGKPVARLVPIASRTPRLLGIAAGLFTVPEDFDSPLPSDIQGAFGISS